MNIQILKKNSRKKYLPHLFFLGQLPDYLSVVHIAAYGWLTTGRLILPLGNLLLSELQICVKAVKRLGIPWTDQGFTTQK